jgi:hypothetical protein
VLVPGLQPVLIGERCVDQSYVGKRLREITQRRSRGRVGFLAVQAQVVPERQQVLKKLGGFLERPASQRQIFRGPEAADAKCPFAGRPLR